MSSQPAPVDPFASSESVPAVSFADAPVGATITGRVTEAPSLVQSRDYNTGEPAFWPDNNPKMSVVTKLVLPNGEERGLWAAKPSAMFAAVSEAQKKAGALIAVGGTLTVTFSGEKPNASNPRLNPQKLYQVSYTPPDHFEAAQPAASSNGWNTPATAPAPAWAAPQPAPTGNPLGAPTTYQQDAARQQQNQQAPQYTPEQVAAAKAAGIPLPGI